MSPAAAVPDSSGRPQQLVLRNHTPEASGKLSSPAGDGHTSASPPFSSPTSRLITQSSTEATGYTGSSPPFLSPSDRTAAQSSAGSPGSSGSAGPGYTRVKKFPHVLGRSSSGDKGESEGSSDSIVVRTDEDSPANQRPRQSASAADLLSLAASAKAASPSGNLPAASPSRGAWEKLSMEVEKELLEGVGATGSVTGEVNAARAVTKGKELRASNRSKSALGVIGRREGAEGSKAVKQLTKTTSFGAVPSSHSGASDSTKEQSNAVAPPATECKLGNEEGGHHAATRAGPASRRQLPLLVHHRSHSRVGAGFGFGAADDVMEEAVEDQLSLSLQDVAPSGLNPKSPNALGSGGLLPGASLFIPNPNSPNARGISLSVFDPNSPTDTTRSPRTPSVFQPLSPIPGPSPRRPSTASHLHASDAVNRDRRGVRPLSPLLTPGKGGGQWGARRKSMGLSSPLPLQLGKASPSPRGAHKAGGWWKSPRRVQGGGEGDQGHSDGRPQTAPEGGWKFPWKRQSGRQPGNQGTVEEESALNEEEGSVMEESGYLHVEQAPWGSVSAESIPLSGEGSLRDVNEGGEEQAWGMGRQAKADVFVLDDEKGRREVEGEEQDAWERDGRRGKGGERRAAKGGRGPSGPFISMSQSQLLPAKGGRGEEMAGQRQKKGPYGPYALPHRNKLSIDFDAESASEGFEIGALHGAPWGMLPQARDEGQQEGSSLPVPPWGKSLTGTRHVAAEERHRYEDERERYATGRPFMPESAPLPPPLLAKSLTGSRHVAKEDRESYKDERDRYTTGRPFMPESAPLPPPLLGKSLTATRYMAAEERESYEDERERYTTGRPFMPEAAPLRARRTKSGLSFGSEDDGMPRVHPFGGHAALPPWQQSPARRGAERDEDGGMPRGSPAGGLPLPPWQQSPSRRGAEREENEGAPRAHPYGAHGLPPWQQSPVRRDEGGGKGGLRAAGRRASADKKLLLEGSGIPLGGLRGAGRRASADKDLLQFPYSGSYAFEEEEEEEEGGARDERRGRGREGGARDELRGREGSVEAQGEKGEGWFGMQRSEGLSDGALQRGGRTVGPTHMDPEEEGKDEEEEEEEEEEETTDMEASRRALSTSAAGHPFCSSRGAEGTEVLEKHNPWVGLPGASRGPALGSTGAYHGSVGDSSADVGGAGSVSNDALSPSTDKGVRVMAQGGDGARSSLPVVLGSSGVGVEGGGSGSSSEYEYEEIDVEIEYESEQEDEEEDGDE